MFLLWGSLTVNVSDSATPVGLYRVKVVELNKLKLRESDLVILRMPIKRIAALPGQHVRFSSEGLYVEGKLLPNSAPEKGIAHTPFGNYIVPPDMFVGMGTEDPDSWDSRYAGFIPQSIVIGTVHPLWTEQR